MMKRLLLGNVLALLCLALPLHDCRAQSQPADCISSSGKPAPFYNLNSAARVPGQFIVTFKSSAGLACIGGSELKTLKVLSGLMPNSRDTSRRLAQALARSIGAKVLSISDTALPAHFVIVTSDHAVRRLALDPRIASIEANLRVKFQ